MLIRAQAHNSPNQHPILQRNYSVSAGSQPQLNSATPPLPSSSTFETSPPHPPVLVSPSPAPNTPTTSNNMSYQTQPHQPRAKQSAGSLKNAASAQRYPSRSGETMQPSASNAPSSGNTSSNGKPQPPPHPNPQSPSIPQTASQPMTQPGSSSSNNSNLPSTGGSNYPGRPATPNQGQSGYPQHARNQPSSASNRLEYGNARPSHKDPLAALQRGEALERRASRRFSAYQLAKLSNGTSSRTDIPDVPLMPSNGKGASYGMGIAGSRGPPPGHPNHPSKQYPGQGNMGGHYLPTKTPGSARMAEYTASTTLVNNNEMANPSGIVSNSPNPAVKQANNAPSNVNPGQQFYPISAGNVPVHVTTTRSMSAPTSGKDRPLSLIQQQQQFAQDQYQKIQQGSNQNQAGAGGAQQKSHVPSDPNKIVLFLQIARGVKKCVVDKSDLTIPSLRLLFVDKFAYPMSSDVIPDIYIQDPTSGIRYELDEDGLANDVHQGSLISLNVEVVDEVKKHIDDGFTTLTKHIEDINNKITAHGASIQKINEIQEFMQKGPDFNAASPGRASGFDHHASYLKKSPLRSNSQKHSVPSTPNRDEHVNSGAVTNSENARKVESLRRELSSVKKTAADGIGGMRDTINELLAKTQALKSLSALPPPGDSSRSFMERSFKKLTGDADKLLTDVDDLQDNIEDLRKDVAQRGVRPDAIRLDSVSNDVQNAVKDLDAISNYIKSEKAGWKKIWERELDKICEEQQILKFQEEIIVDLKDDLAKAEETFDLVKQCSSEATKNSSFKQVFLPPPIEGQSVVHAKDAVMNEVVALQPNHEQRLEAIERAEKKRKKELQSRGIDTDSFLREFTGDSSRKSLGSNADEELLDGEPRDKDVTKKKKKKKSSSATGEEKKKKKSKSKKSTGDDETSTKKKKRSKDEDDNAEDDNEERPKGSKNIGDEHPNGDSDEDEDEDDEQGDSLDNAPSTPTFNTKSLAPPGFSGSTKKNSSVTNDGESSIYSATPGSSSSQKVQSLILDASNDNPSHEPSDSYESSQKLQKLTGFSGSHDGSQYAADDSSDPAETAGSVDALSFHSAGQQSNDDSIMPLSTPQSKAAAAAAATTTTTQSNNGDRQFPVVVPLNMSE